MWRRRLLTVSGVFLGFALCLSLYVPVLLVCLLVSVHPALRRLPLVWTFITCYLYFECAGVLRLSWVWLRHRRRPDYTVENRRVQIWWARGLLAMGGLVFRLRFSVTGEEALAGPTAILLVRHTSLGDTVVPLLFFSYPRGAEGIRYVIKKELLISPCLDIAGHRLNTIFVDRSGVNTPQELQRVADMTANAPADESLLIFPEGTRFSNAKKARLRRKHPRLAPQLDRWPDLLPPRLGGVDTMLTHNPGKDVVFIAHAGFEGYADLKELLSGSWRLSRVRIHLWRVPGAEVPADHQAFLFSQWDRMQETITRLKQDTNSQLTSSQ